METLKVNLLVSRGRSYFVDTVDLYSARQRASFLRQASEDLHVKPATLKHDLGKLLFKVEALQEEMVAESVKPRTTVHEMSASEEAQAMRLLKSPKLVATIVQDLEQCGLVGEQTNKLAAYLCATSRKLDDPLAALVQSSSSAGKSTLVDHVLAFMPAEDCVRYSAMTGQALYYVEETALRHKVLAIVEDVGAERATYALKLLQSERALTLAATGRNASGRTSTETFRVQGPVALFLTSTAIDLDPELHNRCLLLCASEDVEQTRAIHRAQREAETLDGLMKKTRRKKIRAVHQNAQRLLRPMPVVNPFAENLEFFDGKTRSRRDHKKYLTLIRTIALLFQHQRETKRARYEKTEIEFIEVTEQDIALANQLGRVLFESANDDLAPQTRRVLATAKWLVGEIAQKRGCPLSDVRFTRRQLRWAAGMEYHQVRVHLDRLVHLEVLRAHGGGRGRQVFYELLGADPVETLLGKQPGLRKSLNFEFEFASSGTPGAQTESPKRNDDLAPEQSSLSRKADVEDESPGAGS